MLSKKIITLLFAAATFNAFSQQAPVPTPHWRPQYHFTPEKNWTNDPNGLFFLNGEFQLYYQHNPFENKWGHMSWGHATSKDLVNWKHLPVAIPEVVSNDTTTWIYSGSAVIDKNNTSGFGKNGKAPIVAIFTADQPKQKKESQFIAYSNDNGMSFTQYKGNPVIDLNKRDFRDPAVFWYEPTRQWIMTVAMVDEHMVRIYGSKNLKEWTKLSDFGPAGYTRNGWECPSLMPLTIDNVNKKVQWVMFVSSGGDHGPLMQYYVGDFDGTTFKPISDVSKTWTVDYGDAFYAAIAWRDAPQNKKILLGWLQEGRKETYPWKGQMSIPHDLSLKLMPEGVVLIQKPSSIITGKLNTLSKGRVFTKPATLLKDNVIKIEGQKAPTGNSYWIDAEFSIKESQKMGFNIFESADGSKKVTVGYDAGKGEMYVDCTTSQKGLKSQRNLINTAPLSINAKGGIRLQILVDNSSLEVFGNGGEKVISTMIQTDASDNKISAFSEGSTTLSNLKIWDMSANK